ncbi:MAG: hypothetical protein AB7S44_03215 [Spirochaetales bacterium]
MSVIDDIKKAIADRKERHNFALIVRDAYLLTLQPDGFGVTYTENEELEQIVISEATYYKAFYWPVWTQLEPDEKLAVLIFMEHKMAREEGRPEGIFVIDHFNRSFNCSRNGDNYFYELDSALFGFPSTKTYSIVSHTVEEIEGSADIEKLELQEEKREYYSYFFAQIVYNLAKRIMAYENSAKLDEKTLEYYKNMPDGGKDELAHIVNLNYEFPMPEFFPKILKDLMEDQAVITLNKEQSIEYLKYISQVFYQDDYESLKKVEENIYNLITDEQFGFGVEDPMFQQFKDWIETVKVFEANVAEKLLPGREMIDIYINFVHKQQEEEETPKGQVHLERE